MSTLGFPKGQLPSLYFEGYNYETWHYSKNLIANISLLNDKNTVDKQFESYLSVPLLKIQRSASCLCLEEWITYSEHFCSSDHILRFYRHLEEAA